MPNVELRDVTMRFGDVVAVHDLNLRVDDGEYVTILGPSGCGKTTSIKIISGIWRATKGKVFIDGKEVSDVPMEDRHIGYVFQNIALFPHMSVEQNVSYGPRVNDLDAADVSERAEEAMSLVNMLDRRGMMPSELPGGDMQKVALARVLASGSRLLLLDEPLSALDTRVRVDLRHEIRRIVKRLGLTVIHVTHDQEEAMAVSDRIIVIRDGTVVEVNTPTELYRRPKALFTAHFIGETNLLPGRVVSVDDEVTTVEVRGGDRIRAIAKGFGIGDPVVLSARPEYVYPATSGLTVRVTRSTFMGTYVRVAGRTTGDDEVEYDMDSTSNIPDEGEDVTVVFNKRMTVIYNMPERGLEEAIRLE